MNKIKILPFILIFGIASFVCGYFLNDIIFINFSFSEYRSLILLTLPFLGGLFIALIAIGYIFIFFEARPYKIIFPFFGGLVLLAGLFLNNSLQLEIILFSFLIITLAYILGLVLMGSSIYKTYTNLIKPDDAHAISTGIRNVLFFLSIAIALAVYLIYSNQLYKEYVNKQITDMIVEPVSGIISTMIDDQVNTVINDQFNNLKSFNSNEGIIMQLNNTLLQNFGIEIPNLYFEKGKTGNLELPELNLSEMLKPIIAKKVHDIIAPYQQYFAVLLALLVYFVVTTLFFLLRVFISPVVKISSVLLINAGYVQITRVTVESERYTL